MTWVLLGESFLLLLVSVALFSIIFETFRRGISPMPSSKKTRQVMLSMIPTDTVGFIHELGAGFGGLTFALSRHCPKAQIVAFESSFFPWLWCVLWLRIRPISNVQFYRSDFFKANHQHAKVVTAYLFVEGMARLEPILWGTLSPGSIVVSHTFAFRKWAPVETVKAHDLFRSPIYRYQR